MVTIITAAQAKALLNTKRIPTDTELATYRIMVERRIIEAAHLGNELKDPFYAVDEHVIPYLQKELTELGYTVSTERRPFGKPTLTW